MARTTTMADADSPLRVGPKALGDVDARTAHLCIHATARDKPADDGALTRLRHLRSLGLRGHLDRLDLVALGAAALPKLERLTLEGPFTDVDLGRLQLSALPALETLCFGGDIPRSPLGAALSTLPRLPRVRALSLAHHRIDDADLEALPPLDLRELDVRHTKVKSLAAVERWASLDTLLAQGAPLHISSMAGLPALTTADLRTPQGLTETALTTLRPALRRLAITVATPGALAALASDTIEGLWLASPHDRASRPATLAGLRRAPALRTLSIVGLDTSDADLEAIAALPSLQTLEIADVAWLSDRTLEILRASTSLRQLRALWHEADPFSRPARAHLRSSTAIELTRGYEGFPRPTRLPWLPDR